ncbi:hypothetical protein GSI_10479 [Ganoderma sinense ZZ0214-1]|uniref:Uncharacterized protein n=1 Tax=Ganoderma sinense ZZ0214-1 TaxID=1077348 RepID=A0A2G8S0N4_9APHY|nr:hypothetical protein GSI_10479 [Ganoderma sinense ZZ0214-1]
MKHLVVKTASPEAKKLVLNIFRTNERPLTIQELYKEATSSPDLTETDESSIIHSMRYLKKVVLPDLEQRGQVEKVHTKRPLSGEEAAKFQANLTKGKKTAAVPEYNWLWLWQLKAAVPEKPPRPEKKAFGAEVGVGEDWSHLNKRRQRARQEKVGRDVQWLRELKKAEAEAKAESSP